MRPAASMVRRAALLLVTVLSCVSGCGSSPIAARIQAAPIAVGEDRVRAMLERVAKARGLPIKRGVPQKTLDRAGMLARVVQDLQRGGERSVADSKGDVLAALGLVPPDYDFAAGERKVL